MQTVVDETVLEGLDWTFVPPCSARSAHDHTVPEAVWFRVLDCGCEAWLCEDHGAHDARISRHRGMGNCTICRMVVGVRVMERIS